MILCFTWKVRDFNELRASIVTGANASSCSTGMEKENETRSKVANIKTRIKDPSFLPNSYCFSSSYHVGVFKQGKFHGTESKMHSLTLQLKHNLPSSFKKHRTKCQILSASYRVILNLNPVPTINLMKGVVLTSSSGGPIGRERWFLRVTYLSEAEEKSGQENLTALIFAAGCRPPAAPEPSLH